MLYCENHKNSNTKWHFTPTKKTCNRIPYFEKMYLEGDNDTYDWKIL